MDVQKAIMDRRSTRGFDGAPLTDAEIKTLVDAALQSPSAMNKQPWHFAFVKDPAVLADFNAQAREFMATHAPEPMRARFAAPDFQLLMNAPLFVVISTAQEGPFVGVDCGIAVENLALSAMGLGLGSVIVGMPKDVIESEVGPAIKEKFGIPAENHFVVGILIGHNTVTKDAHPIEEGRLTIV